MSLLFVMNSVAGLAQLQLGISSILAATPMQQTDEITQEKLDREALLICSLGSMKLMPACLTCNLALIVMHLIFYSFCKDLVEVFAHVIC